MSLPIRIAQRAGQDMALPYGWSWENADEEVADCYLQAVDQSIQRLASSPQLGPHGPGKPISAGAVARPGLVVFNSERAEGLTQPERAGIFTVNLLPEGAAPLAQAYAGHQFGGFTLLGDGWAILPGEQITPGGQRFDIQLTRPRKAGSSCAEPALGLSPAGLLLWMGIVVGLPTRVLP